MCVECPPAVCPESGRRGGIVQKTVYVKRSHAGILMIQSPPGTPAGKFFPKESLCHGMFFTGESFKCFVKIF